MKGGNRLFYSPITPEVAKLVNLVRLEFNANQLEYQYLNVESCPTHWESYRT
jgi:hypothetical protein